MTLLREIFSKIWDNIPTMAIAIGGVFALVQWSKSKEINRAELVRTLIEKVNDDEEIAEVMKIIDWEEGLKYNRKFYLSEKSATEKSAGQIANGVIKDLELSIDKTLAHYNYICYLKKQKIFTKADIYPFEYDLSRIFNNQNVCNYLYSIYHFSNLNNAKTSFYYLIMYGVERKYLDKSFFDGESKEYTNFLRLI